MPVEESWAEAVIRLLNTSDKPLSQREIAAVFGVKHLSARQQATLDMMVLGGYIKDEKVPHKGPISYMHVYSPVKPTPSKK